MISHANLFVLPLSLSSFCSSSVSRFRVQRTSMQRMHCTVGRVQGAGTLKHAMMPCMCQQRLLQLAPELWQTLCAHTASYQLHRQQQLLSQAVFVSCRCHRHCHRRLLMWQRQHQCWLMWQQMWRQCQRQSARGWRRLRPRSLTLRLQAAAPPAVAATAAACSSSRSATHRGGWVCLPCSCVLLALLILLAYRSAEHLQCGALSQCWCSTCSASHHAWLKHDLT